MVIVVIVSVGIVVKVVTSYGGHFGVVVGVGVRGEVVVVRDGVVVVRGRG